MHRHRLMLRAQRFRARPRPRRASAGFTLIELMVVVIIVGISAAAVGPSMSAALSIQRTQRGQADLLRLIGRARTEAIGNGRAMLLVQNDGGEQYLLYRGDATTCARSSWAAIIEGDAPVDGIRTATYSSVTFATSIAAAEGTPEQLCFQPDGERLGRAAEGAFVRDPATYVFVVQRTDGATPLDVPREIAVPQFAAPRVMR